MKHTFTYIAFCFECHSLPTFATVPHDTRFLRFLVGQEHSVIGTMSFTSM